MVGLAYSALKQRLTTELAPAYVDWFYGQYLEDEMEGGGQLLWQTPAIFIEFMPIEWMTMGQNIQRATLRFHVHLVNETMFDDDRRVVGDVALDHLGQESRIFQKLQNWRANLSDTPTLAALQNTDDDWVLIESIVRKSSESDHTMRRQLVSVQTFEATVFDYSAYPIWQNVLATLALDVQKVAHL